MDDPGLIELCMMPYLLNIDMKSAFDVYVDNANRDMISVKISVKMCYDFSEDSMIPAKI